VADGAFVDQGTQVRVTDVSGNHIVVAAIEEKA
jgi:membrane protein implicated in regulation of membrane protease activity